MVFYDFNVQPGNYSSTAIINLPTDSLLSTSSLTRVTVPFLNASSHVLRQIKADIICIECTDYQQLKGAIDLQPDLLAFKPSKTLILKPGFIRDAIHEKNIFIEINFNNMDREWLRMIISLLNITKGKNIVSGSNLKRCEEEILLFYRGFLSKRNVDKMIMNGERLLKMCAKRRYTFRGVIGNDQKSGILKENFIIKGDY